LKGAVRCPVAVNLAVPIEGMGGRRSGEPARVEISTAAGTFSVKGGVSTIFAPLFKLVMLTSGCPVLDRLRPLAASRLPMIWTRIGLGDLAGNYLVEQSRKERAGGPPDWRLELFAGFLKQVSRVAGALTERVREAGPSDGPVNAALSVVATMELAHMQFTRDGLAGMSPQYAPSSRASDSRSRE
jgi:hypothetical protein